MVEFEEEIGIQTKNRIVEYTLEDIAKKFENQYKGKLFVEMYEGYDGDLPIDGNLFYILEETKNTKYVLGIIPIQQTKSNFILGIKMLEEGDEEMSVYFLDDKIKDFDKENFLNLAERCGIKKVNIQKGP